MNKHPSNNGPLGGSVAPGIPKDQAVGGPSHSSDGPHSFHGRRTPFSLDEATASGKQIEQLKGPRDQDEEVVIRRAKNCLAEYIHLNCDYNVSIIFLI